MSFRMARVLRKLCEEARTNEVLISAGGRGIYKSSWRPAGPICLTCGREVESEQIVEDWKYGLKVLTRCHGQEELRTYDFGTQYWDYERLRSARMSDRLFDPLRGHSEPGALPILNAPANDMQGSAAVAREAHNLEVGGSNPSPAPEKETA